MSDELQKITEVVDGAIKQAYSLKVNCPNCQKEIQLARTALYKDNKMTMEIVTEDGHMLQAETIAGVMSNAAKMLKERARDLGVRIEVLVPQIRFAAKKVKIDFMSVAIKKRGRSTPEEAK